MLDLSSPDLIRLLVEQAPSAVAVFDREMRYLAANDRHLIAYGLAAEGDVTALSHYDLVSGGAEQWRDCQRACLSQARSCGGEATLTFSRRRQGDREEGAPRQVCWEMHPWRDTNGHVAGLVVFTQTFEDADGEQSCAWERLRHAEAEARRAREELSAAREEVLEASRVKSTFLATISHELRTPLASILLFCEMLHEDALSDNNASLAADLSRVVGAGQQLQALIDDLLDFAKLEAGRSRLELSPFSIDDLVLKIAADIRPLAEKTGNTLEVRTPGPLGVMVADAGKVRQSLMNLLTNACKFTEHGRIVLEVQREEGAHQQEFVVFQVHDTGIGISKEVLPRLFRDFVQGDPSLTRKYGGTGLGLAMTRRYVEMMGGSVSAASEPGQGAVFTIRLPAESPS